MNLKLFSVFMAAFAVQVMIFAQEQTVPRSIWIEETPSIPLVRNGIPAVEIVVPEQSSRVTEFASKELQSVLSESLGRKIDIIKAPRKDKTSIILGDNEFSRKAGIDVNTLPRDGFIIRSGGNRIFIAGRDNPQTDIEWARNQLSIWANNFERGTLNGVYDFLERFCGVRFYFPVNSGPSFPSTWSWQSRR